MSDDAAACRSDQIHSKLTEVERELGRLRRHLVETNEAVSAVLRLVSTQGSADYLHTLTARRFRLKSQNEEDGITLALLAAVGPPLRRFVELGAGTNGGNSGFLAQELGFTGVMVDASEKNVATLRGWIPPEIRVEQAWITAESVNELVVGWGFGGEIDVLSLDIDGNEYWIWRELAACNPRIAIVEYNSLFGPDRSVTIPYDPEFSIKGRFGSAYFYGASLGALTQLAREKGYRLVAVEPQGVNAFFLRSDLAHDVPTREPADAYRMNYKHRSRLMKGFDIWHAIEVDGHTIIDLQEPQGR
jgi:hypothetical protein